MSKLSASWKTWRNDRRRALIEEGVPGATAAKLAAKEARGRARLAPFIGDDLAKAAPLKMAGPGGRPRFYLAVPSGFLPPDARRALAVLETLKESLCPL